MSVRESLIKHLTSILRSSSGTLLVTLCDYNGLSIAKIGRKTDLDLNPNQITSLSSAAFSASAENWEDLQIKDQVTSFIYFDEVCLITIRINETLLTIVHDYHIEWPLNADNIASAMYYLKEKLSEFFGNKIANEQQLQEFSNNIRSAIYLFSMGSDVSFASYAPEDKREQNVLPYISNILDSIENPIFYRYSLVNPSGLTLDAREVSENSFPITIEAFSANANVAFQKMKDESEGSPLGEVLCYIAISGQDPENYFGIITCPSGKLKFSKIERTSNIEDLSFAGLFTLAYGGVPVMGETRNLVHSILEIVGSDKITENFIEAVNILTSQKYE
ncbi:MAG: hypothetical protein GF353_26750 [Candidatus Lokiarchaeota archaeon]|nr:hypothetical protein [Candidatus Lokiarchaeota archaeon]